VHRVRWEEVPPHVRARLGELLGAPVAEVVEVAGGYSPALAAAVALADGRRVFVKAVSGEQNPDSPDFIRRELTRHGALPPEARAPALLHAFDDGDWVGGVFEHVDGRLPRLPWDPDELDRAAEAVVALGEVAAPAALPPAPEHVAPIFDGWRLLAADAPTDDWWCSRLDDLLALEQASFAAIEGDRLLHFDVRSDNLLLTGSDVVLVDWAHCCAGPSWFDVLAWLPSIAIEGGDAEALLRQLPDSDEVTAALAALAGYFLSRGRMPDPPGLPTVRAFQLAQAQPALRWLRRRL
jgi:hypothetical protein